MKIILTTDVEDLGHKGDVVDVADGYARNFLVPKGKAIKATRGALKEAEALRPLQAASTDGLPVHGPSEELDVVDTLLDRARRAGASVPPAFPEVRRRLVAELPPWHEDAGRPAHRDLHDGQVLEHGGELVLLDFDLLSRADPLLDVANMLSHLKLRELQGLCGARSGTVDACGRPLLEGLGRDSEPGARDRLRFYQAATFLRLVLVYALRRRWEHLGPDLLELASRCVDDR